VTLTRSTRSAVALVTALLLLFCQAAFAAQACAHTAVLAQPAETAPCHGTSEHGNDGAPATPAANACDAGKAVGDAAKVQVLTLAELPVAAIAYGEVVPQRVRSVAPSCANAVCYSPPLSILHCRFLN